MKRNGFTIIELMIVVAIIVILAAIAVPAYRDYVDSHNCQESGGTILKDGDIFARDENHKLICQKSKPTKQQKKSKPIVDKSAMVRDTEAFIMYREAVKGCPRAESRLNTYIYMGEPLDTNKKNDLEKLISQCEGGK